MHYSLYFINLIIIIEFLKKILYKYENRLKELAETDNASEGEMEWGV